VLLSRIQAYESFEIFGTQGKQTVVDSLQEFYKDFGKRRNQLTSHLGGGRE
jgi:hypothetical protein